LFREAFTDNYSNDPLDLLTQIPVTPIVGSGLSKSFFQLPRVKLRLKKNVL